MTDHEIELLSTIITEEPTVIKEGHIPAYHPGSGTYTVEDVTINPGDANLNGYVMGNIAYTYDVKVTGGWWPRTRADEEGESSVDVSITRLTDVDIQNAVDGNGQPVPVTPQLIQNAKQLFIDKYQYDAADYEEKHNINGGPDRFDYADDYYGND